MSKPIQPVAWDILPREDEPLIVWTLSFPASWRAMNPATVQRNNQVAALRQLRQFLEHDICNEGYKDVTLLVDTQNIRMSLTGFQNPYVLRDVWRLDKLDAGIPIDTLRGRMRVIRLRTWRSNETPEWFPIENTQPIQSVQSVWSVPGNDRLFFNIAAKPNTMKGIREGKQGNPDEHYAIASILEVYLAALQEEDKHNLAIWAGAIDQWRKMGYLTDAMTLHPIPLQWAIHVDRYAEVIGPWIFPREWEEENADVNEDEGDHEQVSWEQHLSSLDF